MAKGRALALDLARRLLNFYYSDNPGSAPEASASPADIPQNQLEADVYDDMDQSDEDLMYNLLLSQNETPQVSEGGIIIFFAT